ncbi:MAG: CHRD domain-containing protein, partial [Cytophagales bacterium]|nr:CHRD domain-containing protein [Cytophagales bacterium]
TGFPTGSTNQTFSSATPALDATQEQELLNGKWYVNIHSSTVPGGELRGQLLR